MRDISLANVSEAALRELYLSEQMPISRYLEEIDRRKAVKKSRLAVIDGGKKD